MKKIFLNDNIIFFIISVNSVIIFTLTFDLFKENLALNNLENLFAVFFIIEAFYKINYYGIRSYFKDNWNKFDFIIVFVTLPSLVLYFFDVNDWSFILIFRLARIFRFIKLIKILPDIDSMIAGVIRALRASIVVLITLFVYNLILSVVTCYLFKNAAPEYFGDPILSFYSIFSIFTIEGWFEIPKVISQNCSSITSALAKIYFSLVRSSCGNYHLNT